MLKANRESIRAAIAEMDARALANGFRPDQSMTEFMDALEGLDLTPSEWGTVSWFLGWDSNANMASIIRKARAAGNS